jgi:hypothetical protein
MIFERRRAAERNVLREVFVSRSWGGRDELGAEHGRVLADRGDHFGHGRARVVLDVRGDLGDRAQLQAERADVQLFSKELGDALGRVEGRVDLDVERDERRPGCDQGGAGGRMELGRAEVGRSALQSPGLAQLGPGSAAGQLAVEVDGEAEPAELVGQHERFGARRALVFLTQVDDRRDVERPHPRVQAAMVREVDRFEDHARARENLLMQLPRLAEQREHRAVVVGVAGPVDGLQRRRDAVELGLVTPFGHVRHRDQHGARSCQVPDRSLS